MSNKLYYYVSVCSLSLLQGCPCGEFLLSINFLLYPLDTIAMLMTRNCSFLSPHPTSEQHSLFWCKLFMLSLNWWGLICYLLIHPKLNSSSLDYHNNLQNSLKTLLFFQTIPLYLPLYDWSFHSSPSSIYLVWYRRHGTVLVLFLLI